MQRQPKAALRSCPFCGTKKHISPQECNQAFDKLLNSFNDFKIQQRHQENLQHSDRDNASNEKKPPKPARENEVAFALDRSDVPFKQLIKETIDLLNKARLSSGLKRLTSNSTLQRVADSHSLDQAKKGKSFHTGSDGADLRQRLEKEEKYFKNATQDVLCGQTSAKTVAKFLLASKKLKDHVMNKDITECGVGVRKGIDNRMYWTVICTSPAFPSGVAYLRNPRSKHDGFLELSPEQLSKWRRELLSLINGVRAEHGLQSLRESRTLSEVARLHTLDQAKAKQISHFGTDGSELAERMARGGYRRYFGAENVASGQESPSLVHKAFMNSPGHARNVVSPHPVEVGLYVCFAIDGALYWTQVFGKRK